MSSRLFCMALVRRLFMRPVHALCHTDFLPTRRVGVASGLLCILLLSLWGCAKPPRVVVYPKTPSPLYFSDDLQLKSLRLSINRSLARLRGMPDARRYQIGAQSVSVAHLVESLEFFLKILDARPTSAELNALVRRYYDVLGARSFNDDPADDYGVLLTGYYQPIFEGSLTPQGSFQYPLHSVPADLIVKRNARDNSLKIGRKDGSGLLPYWTRREIETGNLAAGYELVWLKDPLDAFILHVQGSGLIRLPNGQVRGIHYAGKNGHPYRSIGKLLIETDRLKAEDVTLSSIRRYIDEHPAERTEILHYNDSYIFFEWTKSHGAIGSLGAVLVPGRSVAVDRSCYPPGGLAYLKSRKPMVYGNGVVEWKDLGRFVVFQDSGSAIKGPGRADLFWGSGEVAGLAAGDMKEKGSLYFLLLKKNYLGKIGTKKRLSLPPAG